MGRDKSILFDIDWSKAKRYLTQYDLEDIRGHCSIKTLEVLDRVYRKL